MAGSPKAKKKKNRSTSVLLVLIKITNDEVIAPLNRR
jgi:hypothetical protein